MNSNPDRELYVNKCLPYTMTQAPRLQVLWNCVELINKYELKGDLVEAGVYKGGSAMLMGYAMKHYGMTNKVIMFDTFAGMTKPSEKDYKLNSIKKPNTIQKWEEKQRDGYNEWAYGSYEEVKSNFEKTGYKKYQMVKGDILKTIPFKIKDIAILRLDTDWYESTKHSMNHLYPCLQDGGFLIVDDYYCWAGAKQAIDEYFNEHNLNKKEIVQVDHSCIIYQKGGQR
jgi:hypothetical protein